MKTLTEAERARFTEWYNMANERIKGCKDEANMLSQGEMITLIGSKDQRRSQLRRGGAVTRMRQIKFKVMRRNPRTNA